MLKRRYGRIFLVVVVVAVAVASWNALARASYHKVDPLDHVIFSRYQNSGIILTGKLLTGGGTPAVGTVVAATTYPFAGGAPGTYHGVVDARGRYAVRVPPGESRLIVIAAPGEASKVKEIVAPGTWLTIHSRSHGRMLFTGGIKTDRRSSLPTLLLQDHAPGGWQTFGAVNPNSHSHLWRFRYRAPKSVRGFRFSFRVASLPNAAWARGASSPKDARVLR